MTEDTRKWEYLLVDHPGRTLLPDVLATNGEIGWELVNSGYEGGSGGTLIFKRPVGISALAELALRGDGYPLDDLCDMCGKPMEDDNFKDHGVPCWNCPPKHPGADPMTLT